MSPHLLPPRMHGQVYIELLIAMAVFSILGLTIFRLAALSSELVSFTRARIAARHLAEERMELLRNLPYQKVGTIGGIPSGTITQVENVVTNGLNYTIRTSIIYVDDPFDQLAPQDTNPTDYKRAKVEVSWTGMASSSRNPIVLVTDISSGKDILIEGGVLTIRVFNANGDPLPQASVHITSSGLTPAVDLNQETNNDGGVSLPGAAACVACYRISISKTGYSSERTYSIQEIANPLKSDQGVFIGKITQISFAIDKLSSLTLSSTNDREGGYAPVGGVSFNLRGNKILGTDAFAQPVYKIDKTYTTDSGGRLTIPNFEWDFYQVYMPTGSSYDIAGSNPLLPINILPDTSVDFDFVVASHTTNTLLSIVKDPSQNLIWAYVRVFDNSGYDQTKAVGLSQTPDFGQAFFSSLQEKTYQLEATASGYLKYTGDVIVNGYTKDEVVLTPE